MSKFFCSDSAAGIDLYATYPNSWPVPPAGLQWGRIVEGITDDGTAGEFMLSQAQADITKYQAVSIQAWQAGVATLLSRDAHLGCPVGVAMVNTVAGDSSWVMITGLADVLCAPTINAFLPVFISGTAGVLSNVAAPGGQVLNALWNDAPYGDRPNVGSMSMNRAHIQGQIT